MFLATLFAKTQVFSTKEIAERELAFFLKSKYAYMGQEHMERFTQAFQREQFGEALKVWNNYVQNMRLGNSIYFATVCECKLDDKFT